MPPAADAFWSEDSAALHDAVQAPSQGTRERLDPPVGLVPPIAGGRRGSQRWSLVAVPVVVALLVVALIGSTEGPAPHAGASHASGSRRLATATAGAQASSHDAATDKFMALINHQRRVTRARANQHRETAGRAHAHTRARATRAGKAHHRPAVQHSAPSPSPTVTAAAATPVVSQSSAPVSTSTTPSASTASTSGSGGSKPATGPPGPTGIGSISGGCTVKCS